MINRDPFDIFQKQLVGFANHSFGRAYLGFGHDSRKIVRVGANGLHYLNNNGSIEAQLRPRNDVQIKLQTAIDLSLAGAGLLGSMFSRPEFAFMMLSSKALNTTAGDGMTNAVATSSGNSAANWNEVHDRAAANHQVDYTSTTTRCGAQYTDRYYIPRCFVPVSLSSIPRGSKARNSPTFRIYVEAKTNDHNDGDDWINLVGATAQASSTSLVSGDYNDCGAVDDPNEYATRIDLGSISVGNNTWTLNAAGKALFNANVKNYLPLGLREGHDALDNQIPGNFNTGNFIDWRTSEHATTNTRPLFTVQYVPPTGAFVIC